MRKNAFGLRCLCLVTVVVFLSMISPLSRDSRASDETQPSVHTGASPPSFPGLRVPRLQINNTDQSLQERLTANALAYLKTEHDIELTGQRPARQLVQRYDGERHRERTAEERISAGQRLHAYFGTTVRRLRNIDVTLTPSGVSVKDGTILLEATEHTTYHYNVPPGSGLPDTSEDQVTHVFVFRNQSANSIEKETVKPSPTRVGYHANTARAVSGTAAPTQITQECDPYGICMVYDSTGCDPYGYYPCSDESFDNSNYCCYAEEAPYNQPIGHQSLDTYNLTRARADSGCAYNGLNAASYAFNWAFGANPSYRVFDNDCTNFVSQSLKGGGWYNKKLLKDYKNWGFWWYNPYGTQNKGQTRSWTQARALQYFIWNSGRGFNTSSICDLNYGDVLVVDWENDGDIDHAMIVTAAVNCLLGGDGLLLSQHSPGRKNKSMHQYLIEVPTAKFYAYWICHNGF